MKESLARTPLDGLHRELGARMVPFAGYELPVQYPRGILAEHTHAREAAALFDVSHMGQIRVTGSEAARELERLMPADLVDLAPGRMRYGVLTNESGGILDDLMVAHAGDHLLLVVNAARKRADLEHLRSHLRAAKAEAFFERALLALQGPRAAAALARLATDAGELAFMDARPLAVGGVECFVSRSGYTGEDGFEIALEAEHAERLARRLLAEPEVEAAGLGARDSLRLEAGLALHGHDIDEGTTPVEAGLVFAIGRARRADGARAGGFPGAERILAELAEGPRRRRVGLRPEGRAPVREGAALVDADDARVGRVTSGGYGPTVGGPVAMGYVAGADAHPGRRLRALVRDKPRAVEVAKLPFVPHRYRRGGGA